MSAVGNAGNGPPSNDTTYDPNNPDHVALVLDQAIMRQFAMKIGLKIMTSVKTGEPLSLM